MKNADGLPARHPVRPQSASAPPFSYPKLVVSIPVTRAGDGPEEVEGPAPDAPQDARGG
ncbi:MAG: hypothetical protein LC647_06825 [Beggiatoa sp.]|nr:hypothetical protein [Beggiatoa sp.]